MRTTSLPTSQANPESLTCCPMADWPTDRKFSENRAIRGMINGVFLGAIFWSLLALTISAIYSMLVRAT